MQTQDRGKKAEISIQRRIYNFSLKWWFFSSIIALIPSWYSLFIQFFGRNWNIIAQDGTMKLGWVAFTVVLMLFSALFIFLRFYADRYNQKMNINAAKMYRTFIKSSESANIDRRKSFLDVIQSGNYKKIAKNALAPYDNPSSRLNPLMVIQKKIENARALLVNLFGIDSTCIGISIFFTDRRGKWKYLRTILASGHDDNYTTFITSSTSAFSVALECGKVFYPDKRTALKEKCYMLDKTENQLKQAGKEVIGSIFCEDISIELDDKKLLPAVFCVNTYGKQVCPENDDPAIRKVEDLFSWIESDIMLELARLCVYEHIGISSGKFRASS